MKTKVLIRFIVILLIVVVSCTKETINTPSSLPAQSSENLVTQQFFIGQSYRGGIIFYIDATRVNTA